LQFEEELIELAYRASKEKQVNESEYSERNAVIVEKRLSEVIESQSRLCDSFTAGNTPEALYNTRITILANEEKALRKQIKDIRKMSDKAMDTLEPVKRVFFEANNARNDYLSADSQQKGLIANNLLWNLEIQGQKVINFRLKQPYARMAEFPKPTNLCEMLRD